MDYEKKYKEAQGWIEKIYPTLQHEQQMEAEAFFPELKESENEKIRQAIHIYLDWLDGRKDCQPKGDYTIKDMIAWLEKQGEQKPKRMILAEAKEAMYAKPAWSEEDEVKINRIVACLENLNVADNDILLKDVDWLKSLKQRIGG